RLENVLCKFYRANLLLPCALRLFRTVSSRGSRLGERSGFVQRNSGEKPVSPCVAQIVDTLYWRHGGGQTVSSGQHLSRLFLLTKLPMRHRQDGIDVCL